MLADCGVPKGFIGMPYAPLPALLRYTEDSVCLIGGTGRRKTSQACALLRRWHEDAIARGEIQEIYSWRPTWKFISLPEFIMELQASFRKDGEETAYEKLQRLGRVPHLILDDLGAEKNTDFVWQSLYCLINDREMNRRHTIITTNYSLEKLNALDSRLSSRIGGMCDLVELTGPDYRVANKTAPRKV